tara:strand:- start:127 stop:441 length:315 start_codon:yes stop_codon:yes gene_type:complete
MTETRQYLTYEFRIREVNEYGDGIIIEDYKLDDWQQARKHLQNWQPQGDVVDFTLEVLEIMTTFDCRTQKETDWDIVGIVYHNYCGSKKVRRLGEKIIKGLLSS